MSFLVNPGKGHLNNYLGKQVSINWISIFFYYKSISIQLWLKVIKSTHTCRIEIFFLKLERKKKKKIDCEGCKRAGDRQMNDELD